MRHQSNGATKPKRRGIRHSEIIALIAPSKEIPSSKRRPLSAEIPDICNLKVSKYNTAMSNRNQAEISARPSGAGGAAAAEVDAPVRTQKAKADAPDIARFIRRTRAAMAGDLYCGEAPPPPDADARREMLATGRAVREMWEKLYADWPNRPPYQEDREKAMAELRAMQAKEWPEGPPDMGSFHAQTRAAMARVDAEKDGKGGVGGEGENAGG